MRKQAVRNGIILAAGSGTRLHRITSAMSRKMLPTYDNPMIYYPSRLMLASIRDILPILTRQDTSRFEQLLGSCADWGISSNFAVQPSPDGLAQAFLIAADLLAGDPGAPILGDNIFHASSQLAKLQRAHERQAGATLFAYTVRDPECFGVAGLDAEDRPVTTDEKPAKPCSRLAVTGLYFDDNAVVEVARALEPSALGPRQARNHRRQSLLSGALRARRRRHRPGSRLSR